jgi:hypothetical protein
MISSGEDEHSASDIGSTAEIMGPEGLAAIDPV